MKTALLIGNGNYADQRLAELKGPPLDVISLADILSDRNIGAFDLVTTLVDATLTDIRERSFDLYNDRHPDDLVLLYISGHGVLDLKGRLFFAVSQTDTNRLPVSTWPAAEITEMMNESHSLRQVLILDCCHSGAFYPGGGRRRGSAPALTADTFDVRGHGRIVLTATTATQYAFENGSGVQDDPSAAFGLFTHHLVEGLRTGNAAPRSRFISVQDAFRYAAQRVRAANPAMTPQQWQDFRGDEPVILARNPKQSRTDSLTRDLTSLSSAIGTLTARPSTTGRLPSVGTRDDAVVKSFHMPLAARKALAVDLSVFLAEESAGPLARGSLEVERIRDHVFAVAAHHALTDSLGLDIAMRHLAKVVFKSVPIARKDVPDARVKAERHFKLDLVRRFRSIDCTTCASGVGDVCNGSAQDNRVVGARGHCILPISVAFRIAVDLASACYEKSLSQRGLPSCKFSLSSMMAAAQRDWCDVWTVFRDSEAELHSEIVVSLKKGSRWDKARYCSLFGLLFLECLGPAWAGIARPTSKGRRERPGALALGWMSWTASEIQRHVAAGGLPRKLAFWPRELDPGAIEAAYQRDMFADLSQSRRSQHDYQAGWETASTTFHSMERFGNLKSETWEVFLKFSCSFNALSSEERLWQGLVAFFDHAFKHGPTTSPFSRALYIISEFEETGDVASFVKQSGVAG